MNSFDYLSVLLSIVLGLGVTNLLTAAAALLRRRGRVRPYWPAAAWMLTLFLAHVQTWWSMFGMRGVEDWTFTAFLVVLLQPVLLFLMTALIAPDPEDLAPGGDLRAAYFREARVFFAVWIALLLNSLLKDLVLSGSLTNPLNLSAHLILIAIGLVGLLSRRERLHAAASVVTLLLLVAYIALLFARLR